MERGLTRFPRDALHSRELGLNMWPLLRVTQVAVLVLWGHGVKPYFQSLQNIFLGLSKHVFEQLVGHMASHGGKVCGVAFL